MCATLSMVSFTVSDLLSDPPTCLKLIGSKCLVTLKNGDTKSGYMTAFDPVSGSVILAKDASNKQLILIMPGNISIIEINDQDKIEIQIQSGIVKSDNLPVDKEESEQRKEMFIKVLQDSKLTFETKSDGSVEVASVAVVKPPYTKNDVFSSNDIILSRIRELIQF